MDSASWPVHIKRDQLEEETEKFRVQLKNGVNAMIGETDKTLLHIFNMHKGTYRAKNSGRITYIFDRNCNRYATENKLITSL